MRGAVFQPQMRSRPRGPEGAIVRRETSGRRVAWYRRTLELDDEPTNRVGLGCACVRAGESEGRKMSARKLLAPPKGIGVQPQMRSRPRGPEGAIVRRETSGRRVAWYRRTLELDDEPTNRVGLGCACVRAGESEGRKMSARKLLAPPKRGRCFADCACDCDDSGNAFLVQNRGFRATGILTVC